MTLTLALVLACNTTVDWEEDTDGDDGNDGNDGNDGKPRTNADLYVAEDSFTQIEEWSSITATALCDDADDILLSGWCEAEGRDWDDVWADWVAWKAVEPASGAVRSGWSCQYDPGNFGNQETITASAICVQVD